MRFNKNTSLFFVHFDNVPEYLLSDIQSTQRIRKDQYFIPYLVAFSNLVLQLFLIFHKRLKDQLLVRLRQAVHQLFPRLFNVSWTGIMNCRDIIYLHIHTVFTVPVLYKDQIQIPG